MLSQILLIILMQGFQALEGKLTDNIVIDAQIRHTPLGQLMGIVQLPIEIKMELKHRFLLTLG